MVGPRTQRVISSVTPVIGVPGAPLIVIGDRNSVAFNGAVSVGLTSITVRPANTDRLSLIIINDSNTEIYFNESATAVIGQGRLNRRGGTAIITDYTGIVTAIAGVAASNLCIIEVDKT